MLFPFYIIYVAFWIINIGGANCVKTPSERYKEFIENYDFVNTTASNKISELYPHINFLSAEKLEMIPVDTIVQLIYMFPEDAGLAVKLVSGLQGERPKKFLMKCDQLQREGLHLSKEVKKTIFEQMIKWKNLGKTDDFPLLYGSQFLIQASAGYLFQLPHDQAYQYLRVLSNKLEFANEEEWAKENAQVKRTWSKLQMDTHYLSLNLRNVTDVNRWKYYLEGMTLIELKELSISSQEAKHLALTLNWSPLQYRILLDELMKDENSIQDLIGNFTSDKIKNLIPRQLSSLPTSLIQSITGIIKNREFQSVPLSFPSAKQMFEFELFHRNEKLDNLSKSLLSDVGPLLFTQSAEQLEQFCESSLPIQMLSKVDSLQYSKLQSYDIMGCGNRTKSIERYFIGLTGLLQAIPSTTFMNTRINLIANELITHLLENIPRGNVPAGAFVLNLIRLHFAKESYLKCLLKNDELLSLISPVEVAREHDNIKFILSKIYENDESRSMKLPFHFVTPLLGKVDLFRWNNKTKPKFPVNFLITGLTCEIISKIPSEEFMTIFAYYNRRRIAIKMDFPKDLQRCVWKEIMKYLRLKAEIQGCKSTCHLIAYLDKSDIKSISGYPLAALPNHLIFESKYPHEIVREIGKLSLPELMLAVPNEKLSNLTSMFIENTVGNNLIGLNELILLGNLTHFLEDYDVGRIKSNSLRFVLEAKMMDTRICANSKKRFYWRDALLKAFGNPMYWESDTILTIGDLLITLSSSDLSSIPSSSMIYAADLLEIGYTRHIDWFPSSMPFYKACMSTLDDSEKTLYQLNIVQLVRIYLLAIQNQLRSVFTATELKQLQHVQEGENMVEYVNTHGIVLDLENDVNYLQSNASTTDNDVNHLQSTASAIDVNFTVNSTLPPSTTGATPISISNVVKDVVDLMSKTTYGNNNSYSFTSFFSNFIPDNLSTISNESDSLPSSKEEGVNGTSTKGYDASLMTSQYEFTSNKVTTEVTDTFENSIPDSTPSSPSTPPIELTPTPTVKVEDETNTPMDIATTDEDMSQQNPSTVDDVFTTEQTYTSSSVLSTTESHFNTTISLGASDVSKEMKIGDITTDSLKVDLSTNEEKYVTSEGNMKMNKASNSLDIETTTEYLNVSTKNPQEEDIKFNLKTKGEIMETTIDLEEGIKSTEQQKDLNQVTVLPTIEEPIKKELGMFNMTKDNVKMFVTSIPPIADSTHLVTTWRLPQAGSTEVEVKKEIGVDVVKLSTTTLAPQIEGNTEVEIKKEIGVDVAKEDSKLSTTTLSPQTEGNTEVGLKKELGVLVVTIDDSYLVTTSRLPHAGSTEVEIKKELGVLDVTIDNSNLVTTLRLPHAGSTEVEIKKELEVGVEKDDSKLSTTTLAPQTEGRTEGKLEMSNKTTDGPNTSTKELNSQSPTTEIPKSSISPENVIKLNNTSSGVESSSIFVVSESTRGGSLHNNTYSRINREVEPHFEISHITKLLKLLKINKYDDLEKFGKRKKREIINVYDPHIKITCDALKVLKGGHELVFTLNDFADMESSQLIDCVEYLATSEIPNGQRKRFWMILQNKVPHHLLGNILRAVTVEELENFNFSLQADWALETLYAFAEYTDNSTLHEAIISKFLKDNSKDLTMEHSKIAWPVAVSLGTILCEAHMSTIRSFLINRNNLLQSWRMLHRIKGCPITCLREIANIAITVLGNSTNWTADVFYMLGPVPAGLKENHWTDLVASGDNFTEFLHPSAVKCLPSEYLKKLNKNQLEKISPIGALSMSKIQRSELSKFQNETLDLITNTNVESIVNATISVESSCIRLKVDKLLYAALFIILFSYF